MSEIYQLVKDDTAPQIKATLTRDDTGTAIDCSDGTVSLFFRKKGGTSLLFTLVSSDVGNNLENGIAIFAFGSNNLAIDPGYYEGEIQITFASGIIETVFEVLNFQVRGDF